MIKELQKSLIEATAKMGQPETCALTGARVHQFKAQ
jgi:hypothetical protein